MFATEDTEITELIADVREQVLYLQELGVEAFDVKLAEIRFDSGELKAESPTVRVPTPDVIPNARSEISNLRSEIPKPAEARPAVSRLGSLPSLAQRPTATARPRNDLPSVAPVPEANFETIEQIRAEIGLDCTRCKLSTLGRSQVVNSTGNFNADLMFVGEAPGADEDEKGFPFVGRAGKLLTDIMMAIGFSRDDVFIGNINRCRPPGNRAPEPDETVACKPFLKREIAVVRPRVIVVLGATAAQNLLETKVPIGKLRGQFHDYLGTQVMPTFHPAYLLRDPHKKREVWEDMKMVRDHLNEVTTK